MQVPRNIPRGADLECGIVSNERSGDISRLARIISDTGQSRAEKQEQNTESFKHSSVLSEEDHHETRSPQADPRIRIRLKRREDPSKALYRCPGILSSRKGLKPLCWNWGLEARRRVVQLQPHDGARAHSSLAYVPCRLSPEHRQQDVWPDLGPSNGLPDRFACIVPCFQWRRTISTEQRLFVADFTGAIGGVSQLFLY
jgi:hypothetical protein